MQEMGLIFIVGMMSSQKAAAHQRRESFDKAPLKRIYTPFSKTRLRGRRI